MYQYLTYFYFNNIISPLDMINRMGNFRTLTENLK